MEPSIGENVSNGAGEGLKAFARTGRRQTHGVVEGEMAFITPGPPCRRHALQRA
jgi:hypothetical protein